MDYLNENMAKAGHLAGRKLLSWVLKREYGIESLPDIEKGSKGKPYFKNYREIFFNISHCDGIVACVCSDYEIGIDVEAKRKVRDGLLGKTLTKREQEQLQRLWGEQKEWGFLHYWTLKESFIKAIGKGLSYPLCDVEFEYRMNHSFFQCVLSLQRVENGNFIEVFSNHPEWQFFQTEFSDAILSVCVNREEQVCLESLSLFQVKDFSGELSIV